MTTKNSQNELLPCPWCGKIPMLDDSSDYWTITCGTDDCFGYRYFDGEMGNTEPSFKRQEDCILKWNTRTLLSQPAKGENKRSFATKPSKECTCSKGDCARTVQVILVCPRCGGQVSKSREITQKPSKVISKEEIDKILAPYIYDQHRKEAVEIIFDYLEGRI